MLPAREEQRARRLAKLRWGLASCPLVQAYDLSFVSLTAYESAWVYAEDEDGRVGLGEAVALPGYGWETSEDLRRTVAALLAGEEARDRDVLVERCRAARARHPFAASAVMTALDLRDFVSHSDRKNPAFGVNAPLSGEASLAALERDVEAALARGYRYLKVKVGRSLERNLAALHLLLSAWPERRFSVVFDANQAFSSDDALSFAAALADRASPRLLWFEQPVDRDDWAAMEKLCQARLAPIMLDECIYDSDDVARAAAIGAYGVKLKLCKNFGVVETLALARQARRAGLEVVFGNGVATDIGGIAEYLTLVAGAQLFSPPAECNGFAKLARPLLGPVLGIDQNGCIVCKAGPGELRNRITAFAKSQI